MSLPRLPGTANGPVAGQGRPLAERQHRRHHERRDLRLDRRERFGRKRDFGPPQERCLLRLLLVGEGGCERRGRLGGQRGLSAIEGGLDGAR